MHDFKGSFYPISLILTDFLDEGIRKKNGWGFKLEKTSVVYILNPTGQCYVVLLLTKSFEKFSAI